MNISVVVDLTYSTPSELLSSIWEDDQFLLSAVLFSQITENQRARLLIQYDPALVAFSHDIRAGGGYDVGGTVETPCQGQEGFCAGFMRRREGNRLPFIPRTSSTAIIPLWNTCGNMHNPSPFHDRQE